MKQYLYKIINILGLILIMYVWYKLSTVWTFNVVISNMEYRSTDLGWKLFILQINLGLFILFAYIPRILRKTTKLGYLEIISFCIIVITIYITIDILLLESSTSLYFIKIYHPITIEETLKFLNTLTLYLFEMIDTKEFPTNYKKDNSFLFAYIQHCSKTHCNGIIIVKMMITLLLENYGKYISDRDKMLLIEYLEDNTIITLLVLLIRIILIIFRRSYLEDNELE